MKNLSSRLRYASRCFLPFAVQAAFIFVGATKAPPTVEQLEANPALQPLHFTTDWIGNTWGFGDNKYVQNDIQYLWVKPDGTVYTGSNWDEGHYAGGIYKDGDRLGTLQDTFQDFAGVLPLCGDNKFVYASRRNGTIRRYAFDGSHAPFDGATGERKNEYKFETKSDHVAVTAIAADAARHRLYTAVEDRTKANETVGATLHVFDIADGIKPQAHNPLSAGVRALVVAKDGTLLAAKMKSKIDTGRICRLSVDGTEAGPAITADAGFDPVALCLDAAGSIYAADGGPDQNVKVFAQDGMAQKSIGEKGGVFSGKIPGRVGPLRFDGITGVGLDAAGNLYVSQNRFGPFADGYAESGTILECYSPDLKQLWILHGLEFVDCADIDPASLDRPVLDAYTKLGHYKLDLSKPNGRQWDYVGATMNFVRYPRDDRFVAANDNGNIRGGAWVRRMKGRKILFITTMCSSHLDVYRFDDANGEVAVPCGRVWNDGIWRDANGDGAEQPDEITKGPGVPPALWMSYWVDSNGDIWESTDGSGKTGVRHLSFIDFDSHGAPLWDYKPDHFRQEIDRLGPAPFNEIYRVQYEADSDTMYLTGYSGEKDSPDHNLFPGYGYGATAFAVKNVGPCVARYDGWSKGNRKPTWAIRIPYGGPKHDNEHACAAAFSVASDYIFVGYEGLFDDANSGRIQVYHATDGRYVGTLHAGPESGNIEGAMDIPYGVHAVKLNTGEYLVFSEDDWHAKVLMYRWTPPTTPVTQTN